MEVYVSQPLGFVIQRHKEKVYKMRKALYGLKQAPRAFNKRIDNFLSQIGFVKSISEHGVYLKALKAVTNIYRLIVCLYVYDLLVAGSSVRDIGEFIRKMMNEFEMSDVGPLSYFPGFS